jgi:transposase
MIYIGFDISKYKHDCFIATEAGLLFSFENTLTGFNELLQHFKPFRKQEMIIGLEATGHYGDNLKSFLTVHGYTFMEINPFLVKKFSDSKSLRKLKTDKKDAKLISEYMMSVDYKAYHHQSYHIQALKTYTRLRSKLVSLRTAQYNMMTKSLDIIFPEYKTFMKEQGYSTTSLYLLKKYTTPDKIRHLNDKHYNFIRRLSMGKFSYIKFSKLVTLASNTIGQSSEAEVYKLKLCIQYVESLNKDIDDLEIKIKSLMKQYPTYFESIKGLGVISAAIILAEFGDISLFENPNQMTAYAGLDSSISQSGTSESVGKLVKRGSSHLRTTLINACMTLMIYNPTFYKYYLMKKDEGKHHRVVMTHLAKKLIRIIFHLEKTQTYFDANKLK